LEKIQLSDVTLLCVDCVNVIRAINVVEKCKAVCEFGDIKLLTSIPNTYEHAVEIRPLDSLLAYSVFMLTDAYKYINTSHVLVVQNDGWIINPHAWNQDWLNYDYIGPLFIQYDNVGVGGFSLRSKAIMEKAASVLPPWDGTLENADYIHYNHVLMYEDGFLSFTMQKYGFKYPSLSEAAIFAQGGNPNPKYYQPYPFGFHGKLQRVDHLTGRVDEVCSHYRNNQPCECAADHRHYLASLENINPLV